MNYYLSLIYSVASHYKSVIVLLLVGIFLLDFSFSNTTVEKKSVTSMMMTNKFTSDSTQVRHLVLQNEDNTLQVMNNVKQPARAGQHILFIKRKGYLTGITYDTVLYGIK